MVVVVKCNSTDEEVGDEEGAMQGEIMATELPGGKLYICPALTLAKGKKKSKLRKKKHIYLIFQKQIRSLTS